MSGISHIEGILKNITEVATTLMDMAEAYGWEQSVSQTTFLVNYNIFQLYIEGEVSVWA